LRKKKKKRKKKEKKKKKKKKKVQSLQNAMNDSTIKAGGTTRKPPGWRLLGRNHRLPVDQKGQKANPQVLVTGGQGDQIQKRRLSRGGFLLWSHNAVQVRRTLGK